MRFRKPSASLLVAYLLFGTFMALESALRRGEEAKSSVAGEADRGTTRLLGSAYGAGLLGLPALAMLNSRRRVPAVLGPGIMAAAICLRSWAALALGRYYTRTLRMQSNQQVVRSGPYRFVRHPGYLGTLMMWTGFGLSTRNWLAGFLSGGAMWLLYRRRIEAEEAMLLRELGSAYADYVATTPRLLPV